MNARRVRVVGSGHSFNKATQTADTLVSLKNLKKVLQIDRNKKTIKVEAGVTLKELNKILHTNRMCFPNAGNTGAQTIAGIVCNATHGSSVHYGSFNENILEIELVTAFGNMLKVTPADAQHFQAACAAQGLLGVVYSVTLACEELFHVRRKERMASLEEALTFADTYKGFFLELWYLPYTQNALIVTMEKILRSSKLSSYQKKAKDFLFGNLYFMVLMLWFKARPWQIPQAMNKMVRRYKTATYEGFVDQMLYSLRFLKSYNMELCFPKEKAREALGILQACLEDHFTTKGSTFFLSLPVNIRFTQSDQKSLLSPAAGRECIYIDLASAKAFKGFESFFRDFETRTQHLGPRPHWGMLFYSDPLTHYPEQNVATFEKTRSTLDPSGKFLNTHFQFFQDYRQAAASRTEISALPTTAPELPLQTELSEPSPEVNF